MKVLKFLAIPIMALGVSVMMTTTASANHATIQAQFNCTTSDKVCFNLTVSTANFDTSRDFTLTLEGHRKGAAGGVFDTISTGTCTLPSSAR